MKPLNLNTMLRNNPYPGRGIILGRSADNGRAVIAYFIMGRSENSRNRVFEETEDGIRTRAHDEGKMTDPSLIIYHPIRLAGRDTIVSNGDQTDTIRDHLLSGESFESALRTRCFEPDPPNLTPRISGLLAPDGSYCLSILKSADGNPTCNHRFFYEYDAPLAGVGHFIHTYQENLTPLPSFVGEPRPIPILAPDAGTFSSEIWSSLNAENKVSLYVRYLDLATGQWESVIHNKHGSSQSGRGTIPLKGVCTL